MSVSTVYMYCISKQFEVAFDKVEYYGKYLQVLVFYSGMAQVGYYRSAINLTTESWVQVCLEPGTQAGRPRPPV